MAKSIWTLSLSCRVIWKHFTQEIRFHHTMSTLKTSLTCSASWCFLRAYHSFTSSQPFSTLFSTGFTSFCFWSFTWKQVDSTKDCQLVPLKQQSLLCCCTLCLEDTWSRTAPSYPIVIQFKSVVLKSILISKNSILSMNMNQTSSPDSLDDSLEIQEEGSTWSSLSCLLFGL